MDIAFTNTPFVDSAENFQTLFCDRAQLQITLKKAATHAYTLNREVIVSFTQSVTRCDPLHVLLAFQHLQMGHHVFWARPAEQRALVGCGATAIIETQGIACVAEAAKTWREMQHLIITGQGAQSGNDHTVSTNGPLLFGGFAFDPLSQHTDLWSGFPDGLLLLSRLLFSRNEQDATLTINIPVHPHDDIAHIESNILADLHRLDKILTHSISQELQANTQQITFTQRNQLPETTWKQMVADAVQRIRQGVFQKVVLARAVEVRNTHNERHNIAIVDILRRLYESYPGAYVFAIQRGERYFTGATPERLLCGADGQLQTMALAGSAPRGITSEEDQRLGEELLHSAKNQEEHHVVVTTIRAALERLCSRVWVADAPHLLRLKNIQHLETPIVGDLVPGHSILEAIEDLHPTPAVGGFPRQAALAEIRDHEQLDRGWYAGPIGWVGTSGDGEFAVALRSALIDEHKATLFAGCGIVADSQPESEYAESCLKLHVMLRGLGCEG